VGHTLPADFSTGSGLRSASCGKMRGSDVHCSGGVRKVRETWLRGHAADSAELQFASRYRDAE
jgi:hypothetical protein